MQEKYRTEIKNRHREDWPRGHAACQPWLLCKYPGNRDGMASLPDSQSSVYWFPSFIGLAKCFELLVWFELCSHVVGQLPIFINKKVETYKDFTVLIHRIDVRGKTEISTTPKNQNLSFLAGSSGGAASMRTWLESKRARRQGQVEGSFRDQRRQGPDNW